MWDEATVDDSLCMKLVMEEEFGFFAAIKEFKYSLFPVSVLTEMESIRRFVVSSSLVVSRRLSSSSLRLVVSRRSHVNETSRDDDARRRRETKRRRDEETSRRRDNASQHVYETEFSSQDTRETKIHRDPVF
ncbi:hypothetical protein F2P81_005192 [Scophthalmus maximus]|uniref:Uncharacterized protein n=1 Tax=Scophthalmus maximus TaxID=52904 RepID=A0A6A4TCX2_SCOMX|nr:hypothetical protein F2P81_005192 [Scophthalmus maximus]